MLIKSYFTVTIRDKRGKILRRFKRVSRSYVRQWNDLHCAAMGINSVNVTDIGNTSRSIAAGSYILAPGGASQTNTGIVFGTDNTAVTISDYAMGALVAHGTGSGELQYQAQTYGAPSVAGSTCSFDTTRVGINGSGGAITVAEIGIHAQSSTYYFLVVRDVLDSSLEVPDGGSITVTYTVKVTV